MELKPRSIPLNVLFAQALTRRLPTNHPKIPLIEKDTRKYMSGYRGEKATDFHLQSFNDKNHLIIRGLRLPHEQDYFQIDTLVLSRKYILLLETKNMPGVLTFDQEQFKQTSIYGEKGYDHPIIQVNRHKKQLQDWLTKHKLTLPPIIPLVVLSHPSVIIETSDLKQVCKVDNLKNKILELATPNKKDIVTDRELKKVAKQLLKGDTPHFPTPQKRYGISAIDIKPGACCPNCFKFQMLRTDRVWICPHCLTHSKDAYRDALLDYFLLVKPTISNKEFRDFLGIDQMKTASYMLASLQLPSTGLKKGRVYHRPLDFLEQLEARYKRLKP